MRLYIRSKPKLHVTKSKRSALKKTIQLISGMPGIDEDDIEVEVEGDTAKVHAKSGERNYHARVPLTKDKKKEKTPSKKTSDDERHRLEKWRMGRGNFP